MNSPQTDAAPEPRVPLWHVRATLVFACNLLGDSLCRLPAIRAAKTTYPDSRVCVVADPRCREVFLGQPFIDEVWVLDRSGGAVAQARAWAQVARQARQLRPDLVLDLYGSSRTALLSRLSGARFRVGSHREGRSRWYNLGHLLDTVQLHEGHIIQRVNELVAPAGIAATTSYVPVAVTEKDRERAESVLADSSTDGDKPLVLLNPGARVEAKRWRADRSAALPEAMRDLEAHWCVIASPGEDSLGTKVVDAAKGAVSLLPVLNIGELAAVMERADALVTGDTGVLHLASAMGLASVIIAGPTSPDLFSHPELALRALFHRDACDAWTEGEQCPLYNTCRDRRCIDAVTVEEVTTSLRELLSGT